jgi:hypothetical protein
MPSVKRENGKLRSKSVSRYIITNYAPAGSGLGAHARAFVNDENRTAIAAAASNCRQLPAHARKRHPAAAPEAVARKGFIGILRAGRQMPAIGTDERRQHQPVCRTRARHCAGPARGMTEAVKSGEAFIGICFDWDGLTGTV